MQNNQSQPPQADNEGDHYPLDYQFTAGQDPTEKKECFMCDKFNVCYIWRDLQRVIASNGPTDKEKLPIKIEDLAYICAQYYPKPVRDLKESLTANEA